MWKLMFKNNLLNIFRNFRKYAGCVFLYLPVEIFFLFIANLSFALSTRKPVGNLDLMTQFSISPQAAFLLMSMLLVNTGVIAYFIYVNPIGLPRMLFLTPTDKRQRLSYIWRLFLLKLLWMMVVMFVLLRITLGGFLYRQTIVTIPVQLAVCLFTIWNLILKTGIYGFKSNNSLEESSSRQEALVNFYWIMYLILQQMLLGITLMCRLYQKYPAAWLMWVVILASDAAIAKYCTTCILEKAASYEQTYIKS